MTVSLRVAECAPVLNARRSGQDVRFRGVSTDTRSLQEGALFVALEGENFDGHDFVSAAEAGGASALLVHKEVDSTLPTLLVDDSLLALGRLAQHWISLLQTTVIAMTGSNGKTTVKEMVASILGEVGPVLATQGNLNNDIGVPLTLLQVDESHHYAVIEMGANHKGEIAYLSGLAQPNVAIITNIGAAHLSGFGTLDDVASAKAEIFEGLDEHGFAIINADDRYAEFLESKADHAHQIHFGMSSGVDVRGGFIDQAFTIRLQSQAIQPELKLLGQHNRLNATAAAAAAQALDIQPERIQSGLEKMKPVAGRLELKRSHYGGPAVIDDSYNANPASTRAAIDVLVEHPGTRILVLGDMLELGETEEAHHREVGRYARAAGVHYVFTVGVLAREAALGFGDGAQAFTDKESLFATLSEWLQQRCTILVKGSRGARMEIIVEWLLKGQASSEVTSEASTANSEGVRSANANQESDDEQDSARRPGADSNNTSLYKKSRPDLKTSGAGTEGVLS